MFSELAFRWSIVCVLAAMTGAFSHRSRAGEKEADEVKCLLSQQLDNSRMARVYSRPMNLFDGTSNAGPSVPGTFFWLEIQDGKDAPSRPVWKEWAVRHRGNGLTPHNFGIAAKDREEAALAFVQGGNIRVLKVLSSNTVVVELAAARRIEENTARGEPYQNDPTNIPVTLMLRPAKVDVSQIKLERIEWQDGRWRVQASTGKQRIVFLRSPSQKEWRLEMEK